jgi:Glycosyltransferase family 6
VTAETLAPHVGIFFIGTGKYIQFFADFYASFEKYFFPDVRKTYFVYSDHEPSVVGGNICWKPIVSEPWPLPTLNRFDYFLSNAEQWVGCTHVLFANANLRPLVPIAFDEFFVPETRLFGVRHPGFAFAKKKWYQPYVGTFDKNVKSTAYVPRHAAKTYFAGGLNGGVSEWWLRVCGSLSTNILVDKSNKINGTGWAIWHDESHINHYFNLVIQPRVLGCEYLYPEGWSLPCEKKILILDKRNFGGHDFLRAN